MVGSIDPRCETLRGTHWPVKVAVMFGTRVAENHLGQRSTTASTGRTYGCKRSDQTFKKTLPWVRNGEAYFRPWMEGIRFREPIFGQLRNLLPSRAVFLTASPERSLPEFGDEEAECSQRPTVGRHGVIVEVALDDLSQPFPLDRDRLVPALPQLLLDGLQLRPHPVSPGFPLEEELAPTPLATDKS